MFPVLPGNGYQAPELQCDQTMKSLSHRGHPAFLLPDLRCSSPTPQDPAAARFFIS